MESLHRRLKGLFQHWGVLRDGPAAARRYWLAAVLVVLSVAVTIMTFALQRRAELRHHESELAQHIEAHVAALQAHINNTLTVAADFRAYIEASGGLRVVKDVTAFAAGLAARHPGVHALGWVPRITHVEREAFETRMRSAGAADFRITEISADGRLVPAGTRDEYFPVAFAEPLRRSDFAIGFDLASEPARRAALEKVRDTGAMAVSGLVPLVGSADAPPGVLVFLPVYRHAPAAQRMPDRRADLAGFVVEPLRIGDLMDTGLKQHFATIGFDEYVFDGGAPSMESLLYFHGARKGETGSSPPPFESRDDDRRWLHRIAVADRQWTVALVAPPDMVRTTYERDELLTLFVGTLVTGSLLIYVILSVRRTRELSREIRQREAIERQLKTASEIVEHSPVMISRWHAADDATAPIPLKMVYASGNVRQLGIDPDGLVSGNVDFFDFVPDDDKTMLSARFRQAIRNTERKLRDVFRVVTTDGATHWVEGNMILDFDAAGQLRGSFGTLQDITEKHNLAEQLNFTNMLLRTQIENSPDGILIVDADRKVLVSNGRFREMWQLPQIVVASRVDDANLKARALQMQDPEKFYERVMYLYEHPEEAGHEDVEFKDGRVFDRHSAALRDPAGKYLGRIWYFRDITDRKRAEEKIMQLARHDSLSGLPNRSVFIEAIHPAVARARRDGKGFAVLYLDLDHFKDVNDTLGHSTGDQLLQAVAERLKLAVRETDTLARFGGDEFAVLQADVDDPTDVGTFAAKLVAAVGAPYELNGNDIRIGTSIGIDVYGPESADPETLLSHADVALYRAKAEGRHTFRFYTDAMNQEVRQRVELQNELRQGIEADQLFLVYQPQVELETGRITGVEALVRWRHPTRGTMLPSNFIPLAEKSGLIIAVGNWVLGAACRQTKKWLDAGLAVPVTGINAAAAQFATGVNVSGQQFKIAGELAEKLKSLLAETGLPPDMLELELTESALMETTQKNNKSLARLRRLGVRIAIDDFGTGYSSLDYLRRFPVDRVKIAQNFVIGLRADSGDAVIVKAAIGLARALGLRVIAEGIETAEQLELLRQWGCLEGQGFYFAEPMTADAIKPLLRAGRIVPPKARLVKRAARSVGSAAAR